MKTFTARQLGKTPAQVFEAACEEPVRIRHDRYKIRDLEFELRAVKRKAKNPVKSVFEGAK